MKYAHLFINFKFLFALVLITSFGFVGAVQAMSIAAVGDISCKSIGKDTVDNIAAHKPQLVLFLGDLSYKTSQDCFFDNSKELENNSKVLVTVGNHDRSSLSELSKHYGIPSEGYYTYTFTDDANITGLIIVMNTEKDFERGSEQYEYVKDNLENSSSYDYKIIISHRNFISCKCVHSPDVDYTIYQDLFKKYGVSLVLSGHNHNYQRFAPIDNVTYIVNGLGGKEVYNLKNADEYNKKFKFESKFNDASGYLDLNITKGKINGKFISNSDYQVKDNFTIFN
ncbi:MAG: metallophosphoesterase [Candidatus Nitrosocosmicus sp.]